MTRPRPPLLARGVAGGAIAALAIALGAAAAISAARAAAAEPARLAAAAPAPTAADAAVTVTLVRWPYT